MSEGSPPKGPGDEHASRGFGLSRALDFGPLDRPIFEDEVLAFAAEVDREPEGISRLAQTPRTGNALPAVLAVIPGLVLFLIGLSSASAALQITGSVLLIGAAVLFYLVLRNGPTQAEDLADYRFRLHGFAVANGLAFTPTQHEYRQKGALFSLGDDDRRTENVLRWPGGELEVGEYHYSGIRSRGSAGIAQWWYARIGLNGPLPDLLLATNANSGFFGLGKLQQPTEQREQVKLHAQGRAKFTLSVAANNIPAAERFIDEPLLELLTRLYVDLEILDGEALLYSQQPLGALDSADWINLVDTTLVLRRRSEAA